MNVINLESAFGRIPDAWHPRIAGEVNESYLKLVKLRGVFVWHKHEQEDELFLVVRGILVIRLRERDMVLKEGEFVVIPRGVEHCPVAEEEVWALLLEPKTTRNTGDAINERTVAAEWLDIN